MNRLLLTALVALAALAALPLRAQLPPPPKDLVDFPLSFADTAPGRVTVENLLDRPAGRLGPVVVRGEHFYTGDRRIRFWGVNLCFSASFPDHAAADRLATRLARFGVNAVRFHHMDNQPFPNGIFADQKLEGLSDEALDRLDYLIAALKRQGIYANLNLHVSRSWSKIHRFENADKLPETYDKIIDLFHPEIIKADRQYAHDLLTHVNKYTGNAYASEPAVCMVEINNENTLFLWGGERAIARLPEPYAGMLNARWNDWLAKKYASREKLAAVWDAGAQPLGQNLLTGKWAAEQHETAKMNVIPTGASHEITVTAVDGTEWHLQYNQPGLKLKKGQYYTVTLTAESPDARSLSVGVSQAHAPWQNLGLTSQLKTSRPGEPATPARVGFTASADDDNARLAFSVGKSTGQIILRDIQLREGGQEGLRQNEDPFPGDTKSSANAVASHTPGAPVTAARTADWFDFLQQLDESYFVDFRNYLKDELKVTAPVTGTIGLGPLGTLSQSKMDFVDAHAYWDHPRFPNQSWSAKDWLINNKPMVDNPDGCPLWSLAATRVAGKPFTVTEYNHAAPNDWQAECVPTIAAYAALQDWDAVYLFSYSHSAQYEKDHAASFFDIEGNWPKMATLPLGARIFLGQAVRPFASTTSFNAHRPQLLAHAAESYYEINKAWRRFANSFPAAALRNRLSIAFNGDAPAVGGGATQAPPPLSFTATTPGTGRFTLIDPHAATFVGFNSGTFPIALGDLTVEKLQTPFAAIILVPADPTKSLKDADRLLLSAVARAENTGQRWNEQRTTVSTHWGSAPPRIEVVKATLSLPHDYLVHPLNTAGEPFKESKTQGQRLTIGDTPAVWYELVRQ